MTRIVKKLIDDDAVGAGKILLENNSSIRAESNLLPGNDVDLIKLNASDQGSLEGTFLYPKTVDGTIGTEVVNVNYVQSAAIPVAHIDLIQTANFVTNSATFVVIEDPGPPTIPFQTTVTLSGKYAVWFNANTTIAVNNALLTAEMFIDGVGIPDTTRFLQSSGGNWQGILSTMTITNINVGQVLDVRVKSSSGNITIDGRQLLLIWLSP